MNKVEELKELKRAYLTMQAACNFKVGGVVKVLRKADTRSLGWTTCWCEEMDSLLGKEVTIKSINNKGFEFNEMPHYRFPFYILEFIKEGEVKKVITIDGKDIEVSLESFEALKRQLCD